MKNDFKNSFILLKLTNMYVIKRSGENEKVHFDKITIRLRKLLYGGLEDNIDPIVITQKICSRINSGITTSEIDTLASQVCMSLITDHPDYGVLASRIVVSNHHKNTDSNFVDVIEKLSNNRDVHGKKSSLVSEELKEIVLKHSDEIQRMIQYERDYDLDFFGFKTLERSYLLKVNDNKNNTKIIVERPQHMFMRVALGIHGFNLEEVKKTYDCLSCKVYTHATPTLFNAGTTRFQGSSCFLMGIEDSVHGIFETLSDCALISKWSGGIGLHISNIRSKGSYIRKTGGNSDGIIPMLKVFNDTARYINQCFAPDTIVYTEAGPRKISKIIKGHMVVTQDGSLKEVLGIKRQFITNEILEIKSFNSLRSVKVTKEHQICVIKQASLLNQQQLVSGLSDGSIKTEYVSASEITETDVLCFPKPKVEETISFHNISTRMYGLMINYAKIIKNDVDFTMNCIITFDKNHCEDAIYFVKQYLTSMNIGTWEESDGIISVRWTFTDFIFRTSFGFSYSDLYDYDGKKRLSYKYICSSDDNILNIIIGIINKNNINQNNEFIFESNIDVVESIKFLLLRLGILSYGKINNENNLYKLYIPLHLGKFVSKNENMFFSNIESIKTTFHDGYVYDLNIKDNHNYLTEMGLVHNSGKRNGSFAIYIEPHHADIFDFLEAKKNNGAEEERARDLFYALWIPDLFMSKVEKNEDWYLMDPDNCKGLNDVYSTEYNDLYNKYVSEGRFVKKIKARDLWQAIISSQVETGTPYMLYKDACNTKSNQKNIGTIKSSNLCVAEDTMILTYEGYYRIKDLDNKEVKVWNGKEWSLTTVKKTGENQKMLNINFSNGMDIKCTPYHKFFIETEKSKPIIVEAKDLEKGMKIIRYEVEMCNTNKNDILHPYTQGLFSADGTYCTQSDEEKRCVFHKIDCTDFCGRHQTNKKNYFDDSLKCSANSYTKRPLLSLYGIKKNLITHIDYESKGSYLEDQDKITLTLPYYLKDKYYVPINNSIDSKLRWLEGYVDGDGTIIENNGIKNIQFSSINKKFMQDVLLMLQTIGITSQIKIAKEEGYSLLPHSKTKRNYRLSIDSTGLNKLVSLGFSTKRLDISNSRLPHHKTNMYTQVINIIDNNEYQDSYCFNEPLEHKGIFNGILTSNCSEIIEYSDSKESSVCNLASICLPSCLEYPKQNFTNWFNLLYDQEKQISNYIFDSSLFLLSKDDCSYCKLLKQLLEDSGLEYSEIDNFTSEKYRQICNLPEFTTVPQLFSIKNSEIFHIGGYDDCWEILKPRLNYKKLSQISYELTINLNKIIDNNFYPTDKTKLSNFKHRPIGIGVQGLADLFFKLRLPFTSDQSKQININIFETIYYGAMKSSLDLAIKHGKYSTFDGSPLSQGKFQFNLWGVNDNELSGLWDWDTLRNEILSHGVRNSLLIALMPTASTSQIMGYNECFECITSNVYARRTLSGNFTLVNKYLVKDLISLGLWKEDVKNLILYHKGSIQKIKNIPSFLKDIYKTVWEINQKELIKMSVERAPFVDQSQSLNLFFDKPDFKTLTECHFYGWKNGLKTGSYYIRTKPASNGQNFGLDINIEQKLKKQTETKDEYDDNDGCINCSA